MTEPEQLPDDLAQLFAAERAAPVVGTAMRTAARARLVATVGRLPLGKAAAAGALGGASKILAVLAIAVGAGTGTYAVVNHGERASAPPPVAASVSLAIEQPAVIPPPVIQLEQPPDAAPLPRVESARVTTGSAAAPAATPTAATSSPAPLASQALLLRRAWALVSAGQAADALALVQDDQHAHPDGELSEERDALVVLALASLQRMDEARAAAAGFIVRYPSSVHRARIERAVEGMP